MRWCAFAALVLTLGCAQNAILELQFRLPATPPDDGTGLPWFAVTVVGAPTPVATAVSLGDLQAIELGNEPQWDCMSIQSRTESIDAEARVRYCRDPDCQTPGDDQRTPHIYRIEHPFYIGRRTYWFAELENVVSRCASGDLCDGAGQDEPAGVCLTRGSDLVGDCGCNADADCCAGDACDCLGGSCFVCESGVCVRNVDRCEVEGCRDGTFSAYGFCDSTGVHDCVTNPSFDRPASFWCAVP